MATSVTAREATLGRATTAEAERRPGSWYLIQVLRYAFLFLITAILLGPLVLAFLGSFKTNAEVLAWPPSFLPSHWDLLGQNSNYVQVWNNVKDQGQPLLPRWVFNSVFLAAVHV